LLELLYGLQSPANRSQLALPIWSVARSAHGTAIVKDILISIIDDDEATRVSLAALMRSKGFDAKTYGSASDFLSAGAQDTSTCIVTDIQMPGISGIALKQHLNDQKCVVPVIMITARTDKRLHDQALKSGAFCLLRKPFKAHALLECIERALAK
jgi:FixJ family two-component response regulator